MPSSSSALPLPRRALAWPWPRRPRAEAVVAATLCAIVTGLVVVPIAAIAVASVRDPYGFSLRAVVNVLGNQAILANTLAVGLGSTVLAVAMGGVLAVSLVRVNTPGRAWLERLAVLPLYLTPLLTAIAWSWLGSPRGGLLNLVWRDGLGLGERLIDLHSAGGVIFVAALSYAPLPLLLIGAALRGMDPALEDSARIHGASAGAVWRRITVPLLMPAILGSAVLVFVQAISLFSVPAVLGMPAGFYVAGTEIYRLLNNYPPRVGLAAAWGLLLLIASALSLAVQSAVLRRRSFVTITGKAFRPRTIRLGGTRFILAGFAAAYIGVSVVLPVLTLLWAALIDFVTVDLSAMHSSLRHFAYVLFEYPKTLLAARNSVVLALAAASIVCGLGLAIAWVVARGRGVARLYLDQLSLMPAAIPSMTLALGVLWTYVGARFVPIYGTLAILLLAYVTHYLAIGVRAASSAIRQLHPELEEAARVSGAGWAATMWHVVAPLTRPALLAGWTLLFVLSLQEVSASVLLYSSGTTTLSVAIFDLWEAGNASAVAAFGVLQMLATFAIILLVTRGRPSQVLT